MKGKDLNATRTCDDLRARIEAGSDRPALVTSLGAVLTRADLLDRANALRLDLGPERRLVFLQASNTVDAVAAYLACLLGSHPVHLFTDHTPAIDALAQRYRPDIFVYPGKSESIVAYEPGPPRTFHRDLALLLSTSGSTGSPKFVKLSLANLVANAASIAEYLGLGRDDRAMTSLPLAYSYGLSVINSHLFSGGSVLLNDVSVSDPTFFDTMARGSATSFAGVPYTFEMLSVATPGWAETPGLRHVTQAGGRLAPDKVRHFAELGTQYGWRFYVMYGQTECAPRIAYLPPELATTNSDCVGVPIPGGKIELLDESGTVLDHPGAIGELVYSGPNVMMGYAFGPENLATDETPSRHHTGDLATWTDTGLLRIVGRLSRFIKPFGLRINLDDIEAMLAPKYPEIAVTGTDEGLVLMLANRIEHEDAALVGLLSEHLNIPSATITVVHSSAIPRLDSGKVDYQAILALSPAPNEKLPSTGRIWRRLLSPSFARRVIAEAGQILGVTNAQWHGVSHIYASILNVSSIAGDATFVTLAGDSLTYIQASIALRDYLGHLPIGWEHMTVDELEQEGVAEQTF